MAPILQVFYAIDKDKKILFCIPMSRRDYPIAVIGAGAGGLVVATGAAKAKKKVLLPALLFGRILLLRHLVSRRRNFHTK